MQMSATEPRFSFGQNWLSFIQHLDEERIQAAERSLKEFLGRDDLGGRTFLDIGCGSGLFSLAARRLGATVHSFDCDADCVACTRTLKDRFFSNDPAWTVEKGSILDENYLDRLGRFDIVYAWGVLHHTGALFKAMEFTGKLVKPGGLLYLAVYNHQPCWSNFHRTVKRLYVNSPWPGRFLILSLYVSFQVLKGLVKDIILFRNPLARYRVKKRLRGMSVWHDWVDWVGAYPFETARPEEVFDFFRKRGFILEKLKTCGGGHGCNEYVFSLPEKAERK